MDANLRSAIVRALRRNVIILLLFVIVAIGFIYSHQEPNQQVPVTEQTAPLTTETQIVHPKPTHIRIPAIGVDADFEEPLGVDANQEVEVPKSFDTVGWYKYGPVPGELGPSVVLGHVDSRLGGPEVFYYLRDLTKGDRIEIDREDGSTVVFEVTRLETVSQAAFPSEEVYGNINFAGLRLITCTGTYDHGTRRYDHNLIVFAKLITN